MAVVINGTTGITTPTESVATTIGVGGATPAASGAGITFPATANLSSNANTLDDYEEGTWTPVYRGSTVAGTVSYSSRGGTYTKIGNTVNAFFSLVDMTCSGASGDLTISSLPFTCTTSNNVRGCYSANIRLYSVDLPNGIANITMNLDGTGQNSMNLICTVDNSSWAAVAVQNGSGFYIEGEITYTTTA